jgi:hypothetical protein
VENTKRLHKYKSSFNVAMQIKLTENTNTLFSVRFIRVSFQKLENEGTAGYRR